MLPKAREVLYLNINLHFGLAQKNPTKQSKPPKTPTPQTVRHCYKNNTIYFFKLSSFPLELNFPILVTLHREMQWLVVS